MPIRIYLITLLLSIYSFARTQCFISAPIEVCAGDCGPVFWLLSDPPGTTYSWSIDCGTITFPNQANPHTACYLTPGLCRIDVVVTRPGLDPDTCTAYTLVHPTSLEAIVEVICFGDSVEINGTYYLPGIYFDTLFGANIYGCDSFLNILVAEIPPKYDTIALSICSGSGDSIIVNGTTYNEDNPTGTEYIIGSMGCIDTIIEVNLTILPIYSTSYQYIGCQGDGFSVVVDSNTYNESNPTGVDTLTATNGCDSIITINLIFHQVYFDTISYLGCTGDSFSITIDSIVYDESNPNGMDTLTTVNGCDSILIIDLIFRALPHDTIMYEGCMGDGYSVMVMDSVFNESHPTGTVIIPTMNCDSIVFVDLHFADCPDSLILTGHQLCVSGTGSEYSWYTCHGIPLPDTTQCITLADTGCVCVSFTDGSGFDTLCLDFNICDLDCEINGPENVCVGDSVLFTFGSNDSTLATIDWAVMLDSATTQHFMATDSIWLVYYLPGCYTVKVFLQDSGCFTSCTDTVCVAEKPFGNLCCHSLACDTCVNLSVSLIGTPPFSFAITDGASIDTVSGINSSVYDYQACPPYDSNVVYTLLWVRDSIAPCNGALINDTASVYLEERPIASIIISVNGDTLKAQPDGFAYGWYDCANTANLSFNQSFVPTSSGCYCVTVSTLLTDCIDSACVNFILDGTSFPDITDEIKCRYDPQCHCILIEGLNNIQGDLQIQIVDVLGRNINYTNKEFEGEDLMSITLEDEVPSLLFISVSSDQFRFTRAVFIPD